MKCPECRAPSHVIESKPKKEYRWRRRECCKASCGRKFTTTETEEDGIMVERIVEYGYMPRNNTAVVSSVGVPIDTKRH